MTGVDKLNQEEMAVLNRKKKEEAKRELEKLKKRKIEREREMEEREREREFMQRQKEAEYHQEWIKQEDSFHLQQVKLRSKIRIEEARAKPIDLLAKYINDEEEEEDLIVDMHEPYTYLNGLTIRDLEDLLVDIRVYTELEPNKNVEYWNDITTVTEDELKKLLRLDPSARDSGDRRDGINQSVIQDVSGLFKGKTAEQLQELHQTINNKIKDEAGIDIGYWESVLAQLKAHMARARLRENHQLVLLKKLHTLKQEQGISTQPKSSTESTTASKKLFPIDNKSKAESDEKLTNKSTNNEDLKEKKLDDEEMSSSDLDDSLDENQDYVCIRAYEAGNYSPKLLDQNELKIDTLIMSVEEDMKRLDFQRMRVLGTGKSMHDTEDEFEKKARETVAMDDTEMPAPAAPAPNASSAAMSASDEANTSAFNVEIPVEHQYLWSDKYRPRKPRYYNRVHTGYDWNQYNKKHYDTDNPPPKTVQGYKFNIFYPDIIDKTKTPTYSITPCTDNKDFGILRFHAGAPYEDVAFKIVNREWDISHRHGFRNQFQNGILQVWFHFRKWKYRR